MLFTPLLVAGGCDGKMKSDLTRHGFTMGGMLEASEPAEAAVVEESPQAQLYRAGMARKRRGQMIEAVAFFRRAAEKGHAGAAYELGAAYAEGNGVPIDLDLAAQWYNTAAARGEPRAQYLIGAAFYLGAGVEQDQVRAVRYLGDAAVQGNADAQFLLAKAFANGRGVAQDRAWAARWYGKAAYQGHPGAQFSYGAVIAAGRGLPQDLGAAYRWVLLAERAGHPDAPLVRTALARRLDREARAVAEAEADRFRPAANRRFADRPTVAYVQYTLDRLGHPPGPVDGISGVQTRNAIRAYQRAENLTDDGALSPALLQHLLETSRTS